MSPSVAPARRSGSIARRNARSRGREDEEGKGDADTRAPSFARIGPQPDELHRIEEALAAAVAAGQPAPLVIGAAYGSVGRRDYGGKKNRALGQSAGVRPFNKADSPRPVFLRRGGRNKVVDVGRSFLAQIAA